MAEHDDVVEYLFDYLEEMTPADVTLTDDTDLAGTLGLDSVTVIDMVFDIEDEYDISVPLNALADVRTAGELARLIHRLR